MAFECYVVLQWLECVGDVVSSVECYALHCLPVSDGWTHPHLSGFYSVLLLHFTTLSLLLHYYIVRFLFSLTVAFYYIVFAFLSLHHLWSRSQRLYVLHTSVHTSVHACMHLTLYVSTISPVSTDGFCRTFALVHLGTKMNWLSFRVGLLRPPIHFDWLTVIKKTNCRHLRCAHCHCTTRRFACRSLTAVGLSATAVALSCINLYHTLQSSEIWHLSRTDIQVTCITMNGWVGWCPGM